MKLQKITPCLWFDGPAEEAAKLYVSVFKDAGFQDSTIEHVSRFGKEGFEIHGRPEGSVMTATFRLAGHQLVGLNGGPHFKFTEAISLQVHCDSQQEVDHFWTRLGEGGDPKAQQCGWLKDKYGLSWQVIPTRLIDMLSDPDAGKVQRVTKAFLQMKKFDIAALERVWEGR